MTELVDDRRDRSADAFGVVALPTHGARTFEVRIDLPEGATNNVSLADNLATGGVSYFLSDNADFDVTYEFAGIASINGQPPSEAAFNVVPADGASGTATWNIGAVVTETEADSSVNDVTPYIRATYAARINNDLDTDVGDTLQNSATVYYTNGDDGTQASDNDTTAAITAIESGLDAAAFLVAAVGVAAAEPETPRLTLGCFAEKLLEVLE